MICSSQSLDRIVDKAIHLKQVRKSGLQFGDTVFITTRNSVYSIQILYDEYFLVSGGWFDRKGLSPIKMKIKGCTWGGSIIKIDVVAACGLCLEFGNRVLTTPIRKVMVIPVTCQN